MFRDDTILSKKFPCIFISGCTEDQLKFLSIYGRQKWTVTILLWEQCLEKIGQNLERVTSLRFLSYWYTYHKVWSNRYLLACLDFLQTQLSCHMCICSVITHTPSHIHNLEWWYHWLTSKYLKSTMWQKGTATSQTNNYYFNVCS